MPRPETHARLRYARYLLLAGTALSGVPAAAGDLPTGGSVAHGSATITTPAPKSMAINQTSDRAVVNWQGFSVGQGARVDITQPSASSAILNRVTGSTPSSIAGQLNANGRVYLVNPNGIVIGNGGAVRTGGGFVASTLGIRDDDFMAGRNEFAGNGRSAAITNRGTIEIGRGGFAALLGGKVDNQGTISVPMGRVGIGAGERATLDLSGDGFLQVEVPSEQVPGDDGALINNVGRITADGGRVEIRAATARQAARNAINLSGVVEARSVSGRSGAIILGGGEGGRVTVSGRLDASAPAQISAAAPPPPRPEIGGSVTVTGDAIELAGASIDVRGPQGGGTIQVGGGYRGLGDLQRASITTVDAATTILADATHSGDGGRVIVWADGNTGFAGNISARGGPAGGNGGFAEVSGKALLSYLGRTDLSAPAGAFGTLLLDPTNVFIEDGDTVGMDGFGEGEEFEYFPDFDFFGENAVLNADDLMAQLGLSNVTVVTTSSGGADGNITVGADLTWNSERTLTLDAEGSIFINNRMTATDGGLELFAADQITTGANGAISVAKFTLFSGDWIQDTGPLPSFSAGDFRISSGGSFLRAAGGTGAVADPYMIIDVYGLQGIDRIGPPENNFALANDIDASGTSGWYDFGEVIEGFNPIGGGEGPLPFAGSLDGRGFEIRELFIDRSCCDPVGLFVSLGETGSVQDLGLVDFNITGGFDVGALAGWSEGSIQRVKATSTGVGGIFGTSSVGGLVGTNRGTEIMFHTYSEADVTQANAEDELNFTAGGLVGSNFGSIGQSYASGDVTGQFGGSLGGLVGFNSESILDAYALGRVSTGTGFDCNCGGLVGMNGGSIIQTYAAGNVQAGLGQRGGLTGTNDAGEGGQGTVDASSFWDTVTTGQPTNDGGTGLTTTQFQNMTGFMALAEPQDWSFVDPDEEILAVWAPPSPGHYPELYALTPVVFVDVDDATRLYGGTNPAFTSTNYGGTEYYVFGPADDTLDIAATLTTPAVPSSPVGSYAIAPSGEFVDSAADQEYRLVVIPGALAVTPAPLTIGAGSGSKVYGQQGIPFPFTVSGLVNDDQVTSVTRQSDGAAATATVAGGPYAITASNAVGTGLEVDGVFNYDITYQPGSLAVTPAPLTIGAGSGNKRYGQEGIPFPFTVSGLVNDDQVTSVTRQSDGAAATATVAGGPYAITASNAVGTGLEVDGVFNYDITYQPGTLTVTPAPLTITAADLQKLFGTTVTFSGDEFTVEGLVNGDLVNFVELFSDGAPADAPVAGSPYAIDASNAEGSGLVSGGVSNYDITYVAGALEVLPLNPNQLPPTLPWLLPPVTLPNPQDSIIVVLSEGGGSAGAGAVGVAGGGQTLGTGQSTVAAAEDTLAAIERVSDDLERRMRDCEATEPETLDFLACVRDALSQYASGLDPNVLSLPEPLRAVSAIIEQATREIETARVTASSRLLTATTDEEIRAIEREALTQARDSVQTAVVEIRKTIELIRADEPQVASLYVEQGDTIAASMQSVEARLTRVVGL